MRADLVALGVRLGWVGADDKEEPALAAVMERLRHEGEGILLIYDNAIDADALKPYLPRGGAARVLVTSNAHAWRGVGGAGRNPPVAEGDRRRLSDRPHRPRAASAPPPRHCRRRLAVCRSPTSRRRPIASGSIFRFAEYRKRFEAAPARLSRRRAPCASRVS